VDLDPSPGVGETSPAGGDVDEVLAEADGVVVVDNPLVLEAGLDRIAGLLARSDSLTYVMTDLQD
jgi:hypothetical protein